MDGIDSATGAMKLTASYFKKNSMQLSMFGTEIFDKVNHVLKINYIDKDKKQMMHFDDIRILCTDYDSFIVSYSRNLNSMWIMTMPIPD